MANALPPRAAAEEPPAPPQDHAPAEGSAPPDRGDLRALLRRWRHDPRAVLFAMVALFAAVFSLASCYRFWSFQTYAWDLGIYNQAMYTTTFDGRFFYYTADIPAGTHGSLFAVHFSPFLLLILPLYAAAPSPPTLLVVQAVAVALAAVPLYGLVRCRLGSSRWGLAVAGAYLLSPVTQGLTWYDFHPEAFLPLTVLAAFYFLEEHRPWPFLLCWVLSLSVVEEIAPFLALFAFLALLPFLLRPSARSAEGLPLPPRWLVAALAIAVLWIVVAFEALSYAGAVGGGAFGVNYGVNWSILGAQSPLVVYPQAILHPSLALEAFSFQASSKLVYLLILFGAVAFLPWVGEDRALLPVLAWVGLVVLSNYPAYYSLGDQYAAYAVPFLYLGLSDGLVHLRPAWATFRARVRSHWPHRTPRAGAASPDGAGRAARVARALLRGERPVGGVLLLATLLAALVASPMLAQPVASFSEITYGVPTVTPQDQLLQRVIDLVPAGASILTTTTIFPEVSGRLNAFVLPTASYFVGNSTFGSAVGGDLNASDYVLIDYRVDPYSSVILWDSVNLTGFGLRAEADGAYLYERGYTGSTEVLAPWSSTSISPGSLLLGNAVLETSLPGSPIYHGAGSANGSELWSGLDLNLVPPGDYEVTLDLRVEGPAGAHALDLDVVRTPITVGLDLVNPSAQGHDYGFIESADPEESEVANMTTAGPEEGLGWQNVTLIAEYPGPGTMETEGWLAGTGCDIWLYGISIAQESPLAPPSALE